jgi:LCP family protein required for cell wall assembly
VSIAGETERPPRPALALYKRFALGALVIVLCTAGAVATYGLLLVKDAADIFVRNSHPIPGIVDALDGVAPGRPQTILVLGSDRRFVDIQQKNPTRSDTMLLIRLDPDKGATAVMSIPRDLKVDIKTPRGIVTDKINAAYALGGPKLTVQTVKRLLGIPVNHVVNVNFGGFKQAVNRVGCVYVDIDRHYFNDNNPPYGGGADYATIDVPAGYQRLCGSKSLDYVRYRHFDNDLVRAARQQDFLRQAKDQVGVGHLFSDRRTMLKIFARYTQTDIRGETAILRLLKLVFESARNPIQEVQFRSELGQTYVTATPEDIQRSVSEFLNARASKGSRAAAQTGSPAGGRPHRRRSSHGLPPGVIPSVPDGRDRAIALQTKLRFPVYYPKVKMASSVYQVDDTRAYDIFDKSRRRHRAYRMVVKVAGMGQYYGVQGMTWKSPPILDHPSETRRLGGRDYELFFDGDRLRLVAWRTSRAVYWISNTLLETVTNKQMLAVARSLSRIGSQ